MGPRKFLKESQIEVICTLVRENKSNKEIAANTGFLLRTVQRWTKKYLATGMCFVPLPYKTAGPKRKVTQRTLNVIHRQVEAQLSITSRKIKQKNMRLLAGIAERSERIFEEGSELQELQACA